MKLKKLIAAVAIAAMTMPAMAKQHIEREYVEWTDVWLPGANRSDLPHILIIGNSITKGYTPKVEPAFEGRAYVGRISNSKCLGDPALFDELESVLKHNKFDIIHFNNGLHGAGYTEEEYDKAFPKLIKLLRKYQPDAKLIWATTTPVRCGEGMTGFTEFSDRVKVRNEIAMKHIAKAGDITVDDLWSVVVDHPEYYAGGDGTHPVESGWEALAAQVTKVLEEALDGK
ncbi:MAG: SGNH/GDSL hydrolase family protein [Muribaculaceae bacterium]|nr:SGNH/GDSL hydrolase family protein [Muribaculaceae bacterium]